MSSKRHVRRQLSQTASAQIARMLYAFLIENGICPACRNAWATDGKRKCQKCLDKRLAYDKGRRP